MTIGEYETMNVVDGLVLPGRFLDVLPKHFNVPLDILCNHVVVFISVYTPLRVLLPVYPVGAELIPSLFS